jgi:hypothetical protein
MVQFIELSLHVILDGRGGQEVGRRDLRQGLQGHWVGHGSPKCIVGRRLEGQRRRPRRYLFGHWLVKEYRIHVDVPERIDCCRIQFYSGGSGTGYSWRLEIVESSRMWIVKGGDGRRLRLLRRGHSQNVDRFPVKRCEISLSVSEGDSGPLKVTNLVPTNDKPMTTKAPIPAISRRELTPSKAICPCRSCSSQDSSTPSSLFPIVYTSVPLCNHQLYSTLT